MRASLLGAGGAWTLTTMRDIHGANMAAITVAFLAGGGSGSDRVLTPAAVLSARCAVAGVPPLAVPHG